MNNVEEIKVPDIDAPIEEWKIPTNFTEGGAEEVSPFVTPEMDLDNLGAPDQPDLDVTIGIVEVLYKVVSVIFTWLIGRPQRWSEVLSLGRSRSAGDNFGMYLWHFFPPLLLVFWIGIYLYKKSESSNYTLGRAFWLALLAIAAVLALLVWGCSGGNSS